MLAGGGVGRQSLLSVGTLALAGWQAGNYTLAGASGSVVILAQPPGNSEIASESGGAVRIRFHGSPDGVYVIQASTNLFEWWNVSTNQCGQDGEWSVTNLAAGPCEFFRAALP